MTSVERRRQAEAVRRRLRDLPEVSAAQRVMAFLSMDDELDTSAIIEDGIAAGRAVYAPRTLTRDRRMIPVRLRSLADAREGAYGIAEPEGEETCAPEDLDLVFVPALAYDRAGRRLGRGAGYYDRFMASPGFHALRMGIGYDCQLIDCVPTEGHDLPVQVVVTAREVARP